MRRGHHAGLHADVEEPENHKQDVQTHHGEVVVPLVADVVGLEDARRVLAVREHRARGDCAAGQAAVVCDACAREPQRGARAECGENDEAVEPESDVPPEPAVRHLRKEANEMAWSGVEWGMAHVLLRIAGARDTDVL